MTSRKLGSALLILLATSTASWAAATAEEAAKIQAAFQAYLGSEAGVVTVAPSGDAYDVALDATPYLNKVKQEGFTHKVDPFRFKATPNGDGTWAVTSSGPFTASASVPNVFSFKMETPQVEWSGNYNEALLSFTESSYSVSKLSITQSQLDPQTKINTNQVSVIDSIIGKGTSTDAGNGLTDSEGTTAFSGLVSSTTMDMPPEMVQAGMPNFNYVANMAKGNYVSTMKGLNTKPVLDLIAFLVARPSKEMIVADQAILKEKLLAMLPVFSSIQSDGTFEDLKLDTGYGQFGFTGGGTNVGMNGAVKDGRFAEGIQISGLTLPATLPLPPWTKGLIPHTFNIGFDVTGFDLDAPARKFITEMDVTKPDPVPPGSEAAYMAAFAPTNSIKLTVPPGEIASDMYSLTYEATTEINFAGLPKVDATFKMKGMDAVIAQLQQAATDPTAQQGMAMLFAAKGIGKADGDTITWVVTMSPEGKLLVNGTDMSAMMGALGGPPPAAPAQ